MAGDPRKDKCSECLGEFLVRVDGSIRHHGPHRKPCRGSGRPPFVKFLPPTDISSMIDGLVTFHPGGPSVSSTKEPTDD
jgi:hypothetical protein